jgi:hypothetical protein
MTDIEKKLERAGEFVDMARDGQPYEEQADCYERAWELTYDAVRLAIEERDAAIHLLADWCQRVTDVGSCWDDWDEGYKNAMNRPTIVRELIDAEIAKIREELKADD